MHEYVYVCVNVIVYMCECVCVRVCVSVCVFLFLLYTPENVFCGIQVDILKDFRMQLQENILRKSLVRYADNFLVLM